MMSGPYALPKVTILTPTRDRPRFLEQCAKYVAEQTYPHKLLEWMVVNSGRMVQVSAGDIKTYVANHSGSVGALRNWGVGCAQGNIIVHFDDDDWHAPDRVERQVLPFLVRPQLELVCTDDYYIGLFDKDPVLGRKSFTWGTDHFASGGTFAYRKRAWRMHPFANIPTGEDAYFATQIRAARGVCVNLRDPGLFVHVQHGQNKALGKMMREGSTEETAEVIKDLMGLGDFVRTKLLSG